MAIIGPLLFAAIGGAIVYTYVLGTKTVSDDQSGLAAAAASFNVGSDGFVNFTGNLSSSDFAWVSPRIPDPIGAEGYWVEVNVTAGDSPTTSAGLGTALELTSDRFWEWAFGPGGGSLTATVSVEIATDSGMSNIVATGTFNVSVTSHP